MSVERLTPQRLADIEAAVTDGCKEGYDRFSAATYRMALDASALLAEVHALQEGLERIRGRVDLATTRVALDVEEIVDEVLAPSGEGSSGKEPQSHAAAPSCGSEAASGARIARSGPLCATCWGRGATDTPHSKDAPADGLCWLCGEEQEPDAVPAPASEPEHDPRRCEEWSGGSCTCRPAPAPVPEGERESTSRLIAEQLSAMDGLDNASKHVEAIRVGKCAEEVGEAMQALIAYHHVNPRKPAGPRSEVIKELCDVALTAKVAIWSFGDDAESKLAEREAAILSRLRAASTSMPQEG